MRERLNNSGGGGCSARSATILKWVILLPVLLVVVLLASPTARRVTVQLDPFDKADPVLRFELRCTRSPSCLRRSASCSAARSPGARPGAAGAARSAQRYGALAGARRMVGAAAAASPPPPRSRPSCRVPSAAEPRPNAGHLGRRPRPDLTFPRLIEALRAGLPRRHRRAGPPPPPIERPGEPAATLLLMPAWQSRAERRLPRREDRLRLSGQCSARPTERFRHLSPDARRHRRAARRDRRAGADAVADRRRLGARRLLSCARGCAPARRWSAPARSRPT